MFRVIFTLLYLKDMITISVISYLAMSAREIFFLRISYLKVTSEGTKVHIYNDSVIHNGEWISHKKILSVLYMKECNH